MDPSEKNSFEEQWKKVFQEASETPPLSAWEGIEARLDKEERKVVPLWWQTPRLWYAAASVAAILLVGIGLWNGSDHAAENKTIGIAASKTDNMSPEVSSEDDAALAKKDESLSKDEEQISSVRPGVSNEDGAALAQKDESAAKNAEQLSSVRPDAGITSPEGVRKQGKSAREQLSGKFDQESLASIEIEKGRIPAISEDYIMEPPLDPVHADLGSRIVAEALDPIGYKDLDVYIQKRYVFYKPAAVQEKPVEKSRNAREYYAAVGLMPATFNPDVKVTSAPAAFANANASRQSLSGNSQAGTSYAVQTQGGKRLSKHWSVETGVSYLQGNSTYEGGGYLLDAATSRSQNVLQSALMDKSSGYLGSNMPSSSPPANALYIDVNKEVRNDYRYLQVPVQAGYTLNPDKKLSYSVLGGMMANFFMNNEIESASGAVITTKASDDVYRSLNWAATTGLRFNYRLSSQWKATLTGSYQKSITSGFKSNETLESRPYLYGVSWGVRYSF